MEAILNCTPHEVAIYTGCLYDPKTGNYVGGEPVMIFPPCGSVATAVSAISAMDPLDLDGIPVPCCKRKFASITKLPGGADMYIVSSVYAQAAAELGEDTSKLLVPYGTVKRGGQTVGCTGLIQN